MMAALVLALAPAWAAPLIISDQDNGRTVTAAAGQQITVNLRHPGSGGYNFLSPEYDHSVLQLLEESRLPATDPRRLGDFGRMVFQFQAIKPGQTALVIPIKRPWEKESQTYLKITISVRPQ